MARRLAYVVAALGAATLPHSAAAQDAHYWTNQYGTRAELLGGLVVGTFTDLSSTYYNPGAIALVSKPTLILTTDAYELVDIGFEDIAGEEIDLRSSRLRRAPSMFALQLPIKGLKKNRLAISVLTRHNFEFAADGRRIVDREALESGASENASAGEAIAELRLGEGWLGVTWAHPIGSKVGLGVTNYFALRSQRTRLQAVAQAVDTAGVGSAVIGFDEFRLTNLRLLWKIGLAFDFRPLTFGISVTTPSVSLLGDGSVLVNAAAINVDPDGDGTATSELESNAQKELGGLYKSPFSVAGGVAYRFGATAVYFTSEWFDSVDEFTAIDAEDFVGQTTGDTISVDVTHELKSVLNWGVGVEHAVSPSLDLYGAFFTDDSAFDPERDSQLAFGLWNIRHVTVGGAFAVGSVGVTVGFSYGRGSRSVEQPVNLSDVAAAEREATYRSYKIILGFEFAL